MVKCKPGDVALISMPGHTCDGWPVRVVRPMRPSDGVDNPVNRWMCRPISRPTLLIEKPDGAVKDQAYVGIHDDRLLPMRDTQGTDEMQCITGPALEFELRRLNAHLDKLRDALLKLKDNLNGDEK